MQPISLNVESKPIELASTHVDIDATDALRKWLYGDGTSEQFEASIQTTQPIRCFDRSEARNFVEEVQRGCEHSLDSICTDAIVGVLEDMAATHPATIYEFGHGEPFDAFESAIRQSHLHSAYADVVISAIATAYARVAGSEFARWCDPRALYRDYLRIATQAVKDRSDTDADYLRELKRSITSGLLRRMAPVPEIAEVLSLAERFPNFSEPIQYIAEQAALSHMRGAKGFRIPPLLLVGPPGIGKTHLAQSLADVLGSHVEIIGMSSATGGFALSGVDRGWATAKAGMIYSAIANGESLAPVVVLDEIDKANSDSKSDPVGPLYQLLEPRTAVAFRDEFVGFGIDASHVVWIATANDLDRVPTALRSRFHVFHIEDPNETQLRKITANMFAELTQGIAIAPESIPSAWLEKLSGCSVRDTRIAMQQALGRAAIRAATSGKATMSLDGMDMQPSPKERLRKRIGFVG